MEFLKVRLQGKSLMGRVLSRKGDRITLREIDKTGAPKSKIKGEVQEDFYILAKESDVICEMVCDAFYGEWVPKNKLSDKHYECVGGSRG